MNYKTENGVIIGNNKEIIHFVKGTPGYVDFPGEVIQTIHQKTPGYIYAMAHSHPPQMAYLSNTDKTTLEAWTRMMYPYPARLITVTKLSEKVFQTTVYLGMLESKESWIARGKEEERKFEIIEEKRKQYYAENSNHTWEQLLISKSYID